MQRYALLLGLAVSLVVTGCGPSVNVQQERDGLLVVDREWSASTRDIDKFISYFASDASVYAPGMPLTTGVDMFRKTFTEMSAAPGFALQWTPSKAEVSAEGNLGHTAGTYEMTMGGVTEKGKYLTVWKKVDSVWKVTDDIFNTSEGQPPIAHVAMTARDITWGDAPPVLPPGAKLAVLSGDPGKAVPFVVRLQMPAGYRIAAHWHPTDENVTVLSGTFAFGMGDKFDAAALKDLPAGGFVALPANMHHFAMAKTAATVQLDGPGPFVINYIDPADDPSKMMMKK